MVYQTFVGLLFAEFFNAETVNMVNEDVNTNP